jgi:hypothetical protein
MPALIDQLREIGAYITTLDLTDPTAASAALRAAFPDGDALTASLRSAHAAGELPVRPAGPAISFGRLARPAEAGGCSIDVVDIAGAGAGHTHPSGEVSWCVPWSGEPEFEGAAAGWVVLAPGSHHVPTVTGGRMLIVYWVPAGKVTWDPAPST